MLQFWVGVSQCLPVTEQLCLEDGGVKPTYSKPGKSCPVSWRIQAEEPRDVL